MSPIQNMPLPEATEAPKEGDKANVLVKAEGNSLRISITWTLIEESPSGDAPYTHIVAAQTGTTLDTTKYPNGVKTPDEQARFLVEDFQSLSIEQQYQIIVADTNITRLGSIEGISLVKSGTTPVTWKATLKFISGDVIVVA